MNKIIGYLKNFEVKVFAKDEQGNLEKYTQVNLFMRVN